MLSTRLRQTEVSGDTDPNFANVTLLLHFEGSNGSTTFTDNSSGNISITASGNAQISTVQSKFGSSSGYFDGNGDYISAASGSEFQLSGDFTVEFWIYPLSSGARSIFDSRINETSPNGNGFVIGTNSSSQWVMYFGSNRIIGSTITTNAWTHVALCRSGTDVKLFLNGNQTGSTYTNSTTNFSDGAFLIGTDYPKNARFFNGYMDEFRITKAARYTANFTAPTAAFPDS